MACPKILAIKLRALGDTVLLTAPLIELTQAFPQSEIHVIVPSNWAPLLEGFPGVTKVWPVQRKIRSFSYLLQLARLSLLLRAEKFDWVINFHASSSSALLSRLTGAKLRSIHFHGHEDSNRFSTVRIPGKGTLKPIIERDMDTLRALGVHIPAGRKPQIYLRPSEMADAQEYLNELNLNDPFLCISLGASRPSKIWPIERFTSLAIEWCQKEKGGVLVLAGSKEESLAETFLKVLDDLLFAMIPEVKKRSLIRKKIVTTHHLPLRKLAAILSQAAVFVGNDSGPKHLSVAVQTPTITLFGPEHPFEWHPYPKEAHPYFFIEKLSCRKDAAPHLPPWCGIHSCIIEEHRCMKEIGIQSVFNQSQKIARRMK